MKASKIEKIKYMATARLGVGLSLLAAGLINIPLSLFGDAPQAAAELIRHISFSLSFVVTGFVVVIYGHKTLDELDEDE